MRTSMHLRTHRDYFHQEPLHVVFSLMVSVLLAGLVVLMFALTAR